ncbi:NPCBM/NEW2 domain-containing protein, partial [Alistipes shahii]|uniref:NPCBM/NEW2 domain-containing protein n=1 Tax=Alistipes shahii TaxID=328814 RepID=UPI00241DB118
MPPNWNLCGAGCVLMALSGSADTISLRDLDLSSMTVGDGKVMLDADVYGGPLVVGGEKFSRGIGVHASSRYELTVEKGAVSGFKAKVGLVNGYPQAKLGSVVFRVYADGRPVAQTPVLRFGDKAVNLEADLKGAKTIGLEVSDAGDGVANDIGAWLEAGFSADSGTVLRPIDLAKCEQLGILTPKAPAAPRINPPRIFGVRPGRPILFTLAVSGERPMRLAVKGLPEGAAFDARTGRLSGAVAKAGTYNLVFTAENARGRDERPFRLVVGDRIALTPPMGWNSWNCFAAAVTGEDIRRAARAFVDLGLVDYGWSYINIDDFWQNHAGKDPAAQDVVGPFRRDDGSVVVNRRFGDLKELTDDIHALG